MADSPVSAERLAFAGISALTVLGWYALPDLVRSRPARVAAKTALLGLTAAGAVALPRVYPGLAAAVPTEAPQQLIEGSPKAGVAIVAGGLAASAAFTVWAEKAIFARGERRRAEGVRWAHTRPALAFAALTGAVMLVDPPLKPAEAVERAV